ncbi:MAG: TrmB family transcriptional regulator [Fusobacteriaceae bacterium]
MDIDYIVKKMEILGLTSKEAEVYVELLKNPSSNGSKIAKILGYPRTSVYDTLSKLQNKGYVMAIQEGDIRSYLPMPPKELLAKIKREVEATTKILDKEFEKINTNWQQTQFYNLNSENEIVGRITEMMITTEKELYINTNWNLEKFKECFEILEKKGVRVVLFSFEKHNYEDLGVEFYHRERLREEISSRNQRILMVSDMKKALMASNYEGELNGTYSENGLLVNILAEHIHNDIYILKLEKNGSSEFWKDIHLGTIQELKEF